MSLLTQQHTESTVQLQLATAHLKQREQALQQVQQQLQQAHEELQSKVVRVFLHCGVDRSVDRTVDHPHLEMPMYTPAHCTR